ncbi:hypothetical protein [Agriterribacter sp.]|uniref:hypothetical protein n=1 Tax=Agriterribacter sp. TaxID=2821509 RepID=UPI002C03628A|nr:hypothetical protein [Agriterribacter sp.]HTN09003.1 hypothetical protein [Agriterribacter sp.]
MKNIVLFAAMFIFGVNVMAQKNWKVLFDQEYSAICTSTETIREYYLNKSISGDSFDFMTISNILDALQCMYLSTGEDTYRNDLVKIINNILSTAKVSKNIPGNIYEYKDNFLSWTSKNTLNSYNNEAPLYEGYIFRFITQFIYNLHQSGWTSLSAENQSWYNQTLQFIEKNIWGKWISRSNEINKKPYTIFLRTRTHTSSHWAFIGFFLKEITVDPLIRTQCIEMHNMYDLLLKRNLKSNPAVPQAYVWNCSWDDVSGTQANVVDEVVLQDVSHGNHVLSYLTVSKKMGNPNWSDSEIDSLCNTLKLVVYNKKEISFADMVDGSPSLSRPGWGNNQAEGWIKLSWFDKEVWNIYVDFAFRQEYGIMRQQNMELQYYANLLYTEYLAK